MGFETSIPVFVQAKTVHALERAVTLIGNMLYLPRKSSSEFSGTSQSRGEGGRRFRIPKRKETGLNKGQATVTFRSWQKCGDKEDDY
jgi:hypothetical protein